MIQLNILCKSEAEPLASQLIEALSGEAGKGTLSVPLVPVGSAEDVEPTWYGASGAISEEFEPLLRDPALLSERAEITLEQAEWLIGNSDVTFRDEEAWTLVLERLGLEVKQAPI